MICPSCGTTLLDDSLFCQNCGCKITVQEEDKEQTPKASKARSKLKVSLIVVAIFAVILGALSVYQGIQLKQKGLQLEQALGENDSLQDEIKVKEEKIKSLQADIKTLQSKEQSQKQKVDSFDAIVQVAQHSTLSSTSSHFYVDRYIIVMKPNSTASLKLTANWSYGGTVHSSTSARGTAYVTFNDNSWYNSVYLTVHSGTSGVATLHFSNTADNIAFDVLVIVTP